MAEALILALSGTLVGVAWSTLGIYLGSLVINENPAAAYTIRALFLVIAVSVHGFVRSKTPRLFISVLLMIICSIVTLTSTATVVTESGATRILYPILIATGVIIVVNICLFPEFSSKFLGQTTIETLNETVNTLDEAGSYFIATALPNSPKKTASKDMTGSFEPQKDPSPASGDLGRFPSVLHRLRSPFATQVSVQGEKNLEEKPKPTMTDLTAAKARIRKKMQDCKATQQECNFEIAVAVLPPRDIKPISVRAMKRLVANTIAVIGACESKFALGGEGERSANYGTVMQAGKSSRDDCEEANKPLSRATPRDLPE